MSKGKLNIVIGAAGCGKSTYINSIKKPSDIVISTDEIRTEIFGNADCQDKSGLVFAIFHGRIAEALSKGKTVWADATNISVLARSDYFKYAKGYFIKAHILPASLETCMYRNANRERKVPSVVISKMIHFIELPTKYEPMTSVVIYNDGDHYYEIPYRGESYYQLIGAHV